MEEGKGHGEEAEGRGEKACGGAASQGTTEGSSDLHHACAHIVKHNMKYSLLLPPNTGFIFVEGKSPRRPASLKVSTQQNTGGDWVRDCDRDRGNKKRCMCGA